MIAVLATLLLAQADPQAIFIGNSLSVDVWNGFISTNEEDSYAKHIRCSRGLAYIHDNPTDTCQTPTHGYWNEALINYEFETIFLQPYIGWGGVEENWELDLRMFHEVRKLQPNANLVLLMTWTSNTNEPLIKWEEPLPSSTVKLSREYSQYLSATLTLAGHHHKVFSPGEAFFQVGSNVSNIPELDSVDDLYRDQWHASTDLGRPIANEMVRRFLDSSHQFPQEWSPELIESIEDSFEITNSVNPILVDAIANSLPPYQLEQVIANEPKSDLIRLVIHQEPI